MLVALTVGVHTYCRRQPPPPKPHEAMPETADIRPPDGDIIYYTDGAGLKQIGKRHLPVTPSYTYNASIAFPVAGKPSTPSSLGVSSLPPRPYAGPSQTLMVKSPPAQTILSEPAKALVQATSRPLIPLPPRASHQMGNGVVITEDGGGGGGGDSYRPPWARATATSTYPTYVNDPPTSTPWAAATSPLPASTLAAAGRSATPTMQTSATWYHA